MGLQNPRDFQGAILTWNDYGAVAPSTFDSKAWTTARAVVTAPGCLLGFTENTPTSFKKLVRFALLNSNQKKLCKTKEIWSCTPKNTRKLLPARRVLKWPFVGQHLVPQWLDPDFAGLVASVCVPLHPPLLSITIFGPATYRPPILWLGHAFSTSDPARRRSVRFVDTHIHIPVQKHRQVPVQVPVEKPVEVNVIETTEKARLFFAWLAGPHGN